MVHSRYVAEPFPLVVVSVGCLAFGGALRANSLDHIVDGFGVETIGQIYGWDRNILKTKGAVADFTVKMHMSVVIRVTVSVAEFVSDPFATVINLVEQMALIEQGEGTEYAGFVNGVNHVLKFRHSDRTMAVSQRFKYQQTVRCRLDTVLV